MNRVWAALLLTIVGATPVIAGTLATGWTIPATVAVRTGNIAFIYFPLTSRAGTPPACAANIGGTNFRYALDISTAGGRSQLALLVTSIASGTGVFFQGAGTCTFDASTEDLAVTELPGPGQ